MSVRPIAIGCMRLSTERDRDEARSIEVLHAAFDAGVTLLDTADAYCRDDGERGHNERLIARALATWPGDRSRIRVATKGGLTRPDGRWVPDGRAKHLVAACEASRRALGVERIDLYQLHAPDPADAAGDQRARPGGARSATGSSARSASATSPSDRSRRRGGSPRSPRCRSSSASGTTTASSAASSSTASRTGMPLLAYRPLGGHQSRRQRTAADPVLTDGGAPRRHAVRGRAGLAARSLGRHRAAARGHARRRRARSIARAHADRADRRGSRASSTGGSRRAARSGTPRRRTHRAPPIAPDGEVVLVMGLPGAGKSTLAADAGRGRATSG